MREVQTCFKGQMGVLFECQDLAGQPSCAERNSAKIVKGRPLRKDAKNLIIGYPGSGKSTQMDIWATQLDRENKPFLYLVTKGAWLNFENQPLGDSSIPLVSSMLFEKYKQSVVSNCKTKQSAFVVVDEDTDLNALCKMLAYAIEQDYHIFIDEIPRLSEQNNILKLFLNSMVQIELALKTTICSRFIGTEPYNNPVNFDFIYDLNIENYRKN